MLHRICNIVCHWAMDHDYYFVYEVCGSVELWLDEHKFK